MGSSNSSNTMKFLAVLFVAMTALVATQPQGADTFNYVSVDTGASTPCDTADARRRGCDQIKTPRQQCLEGCLSAPRPKMCRVDAIASMGRGRGRSFRALIQ